MPKLLWFYLGTLGELAPSTYGYLGPNRLRSRLSFGGGSYAVTYTPQLHPLPHRRPTGFSSSLQKYNYPPAAGSTVFVLLDPLNSSPGNGAVVFQSIDNEWHNCQIFLEKSGRNLSRQKTEPHLEPLHAAPFAFRPREVYPTHSRGASFNTVVKVWSLSTGSRSVTASSRRGPSDTITIYPGAVIIAIDYARSGGVRRHLQGSMGPSHTSLLPCP